MFSKTGKASAIVQKGNTTETSPVNLPVLLYHDAQTCPLNVFIKCLCDEDFYSLIIQGNPTTIEIQAAWWVIYTQFIDLSDEPDIKQMLRLHKVVYQLKYRVLKVQNIVAYIKIQWDEDYINELKGMNFRYKYDINNRKAYDRDLNLILTRLGKWEIEIELYQAEFDAIQAKNAGEKVDRNYFTTALVRLGNFNKYRIDPTVITVAEYCALKKDYISYIKQTEKDNARKR